LIAPACLPAARKAAGRGQVGQEQHHSERQGEKTKKNHREALKRRLKGPAANEAAGGQQAMNLRWTI